MDQFNPELKAKEAIKEQPVFHNVLSLTEEERETLKSRIAESQGLVRIVIHPYYLKQIASLSDSSEYKIKLHGPRATIVEESFDRMLKAKSTVPIMLFDSEERIGGTKQKIDPILKASGNELYLVPTYDASPVPSAKVSKSVEGEWKFFIDIMKNLGVKRLIVGGMYLFVDVSIGSKQNSENLRGCVGVAIDALSPYFAIQTSSIAHPKSRKDISEETLKNYEKIKD